MIPKQAIAEVDDHLNRVDMADFKERAKRLELCPTWRVVRPIFVLVLKVPLIPAKWRDVLETFQGVLDGTCPQ